ncbi:hypothetical protein BDR06DRAFT_1015721 [Suillus hirtellus]|nr:hypothetical protein BDR06DRAFT_1015721 [Suillus hirtellus]
MPPGDQTYTLFISRRLSRRLKIPADPDGPFEYTPEYLAALAIQRKTPESPSPTTHFQTETLAVPADFLQDLVDARWKAERAWCDAEHRLQSQQVQKLPRT